MEVYSSLDLTKAIQLTNFGHDLTSYDRYAP